MSRSKWGPSTNSEIFLLQKCLHLKNLTPLTPARCGYLLYELIFFVVEIQYTFGFVCTVFANHFKTHYIRCDRARSRRSYRTFSDIYIDKGKKLTFRVNYPLYVDKGFDKSPFIVLSFIHKGSYHIKTTERTRGSRQTVPCKQSLSRLYTV